MTFRGRIVVLSVMTTLIIIAIAYITILQQYAAYLRSQIDAKLADDANFVRELIGFKQNGRLELSRQSPSVSGFAGREQIFYLIRDAQQRILRRSANMIYLELAALQPDRQEPFYQDIEFAGRQYRLYTSLYSSLQHTGAEDLFIQTLQPLAPFYASLQQLALTMLILIPIPLALSVIGGGWLAARTLRPVRALIDKVNRIGSSQLDERISIKTADEIGQLSAAFNTFLERLQTSFNALRRFTADASHELRTPLTSIRSQCEVALIKERSGDEYRDLLGSILEEVDRLEHLTEMLLQLARGDAGMIRLNRRLHNVSEIVERWLEHLSPLAEEKNIHIEQTLQADMMYSLDEIIFERILVNLLQNAIAYTPRDGHIDVSLTNEDGLKLSICDNGPGIDDAHKQQVFERFTRLDITRHNSQGAGLGLAIAEWAVRMHGGQVSIHDNQPHGSCFCVSL